MQWALGLELAGRNCFAYTYIYFLILSLGLPHYHQQNVSGPLRWVLLIITVLELVKVKWWSSSVSLWFVKLVALETSAKMPAAWEALSFIQMTSWIILGGAGGLLSAAQPCRTHQTAHAAVIPHTQQWPQVWARSPGIRAKAPPDSVLEQMKPDGQMLLKLFCFQTSVFMVCCHDVRICQGTRKHRACQKSSRGLFWAEGIKSGADHVQALYQ